MLAEEKLHDLIEAALFRRVDAVKVDKKGNLLNKAVLSEGFYRGFLNILFGWELVNANSIEQNFAGVDLIDINKHIAVQVSTKCDHEKIQHSIDEFDNPDGGKWHFYFLAIENNAPKKRADFELPEWLAFDKNDDVLDTARLMQKVQNVNGDREKIDRLLKYVAEKNARDDICLTLLSALKDVRQNHPSFKLMQRDEVDKRLLPDGKDVKPMDAYGSSEGEAGQKVWDIIKSEHKEGFRDIVIEGIGGIGKSVSLLYVTEDEELLMLIPAIYIHMYDLVKDGKVTDIPEFIEKRAKGCAKEIFELSRVSGTPKIMFLLDGLNEVAPEHRYDLMREIREWKNYNPGAQLILASRPLGSNELEIALGKNARKVELNEITDDNASLYLEEQGIRPPIDESIWKVLKRPLFLMLYAKTANLSGEKACGRYPLAVRKNVNAAALIWNYLQRQLLINETREWVLNSVFANEYFAPYIAYRMVGENRFDLSFEDADRLVEEAKQRLGLKWLPKHIAAVGKEYYRSLSRLKLPETDWTRFILEESGLFAEDKENSEKNPSDIYSFLHQNFRDCLAAVYLVGQAEAAEAEEKETNMAKLPEAWRASQSPKVLDYAAELMDEVTADKLWEMNRLSQQYAKPGCKTNTTATYLQLELRERMPKPFEPDFSSMDLRGMSLTRYMGKKEKGVRLFRDPGKTKGTLISRKTFRSDGHTGPVECVSVLSDGRIVSGSNDNTLRIWDVNAGACLKTLEGHTSWVRCISVLPNGRIVSGSNDNTLRVWDADTGECLKTLEGHTNWVRCVSVLPGGRIVSGSNDNTLRIWDVNSGACLKTLEGHTDSVICISVLPDGRIVSGSDDDTLCIWSADTGECKKTLEGHTDWVRCISVLADGRIVSGSDDDTLRVWNADTGKCLKTLEGHTGWVNCISVLPDGRIVAGSNDRTLRVWDADTGECLKTLEGHTDAVICISVLEDGRIVSGSNDCTLRVWNADTGECLKTLEGHTGWVRCISVLADGRIVSGSDDDTLRVWNADTGKCLKTLEGHTGWVNCISVLPDGRIVAGSNDRTLRVWNADTGKCLKTLEGHTGWVNCISVLPDGRVVSGSEDGTLRIWDADTGECLKTLEGHTDWVNCVYVLPDGRVVSGSEDGTLRIWDADTGECLKTLEGHIGPVNCISVLPDGRIVAGSNDRTLRVWDADTGECLKTLEGHTGWVRCISVLADGRIVSGSDDDTLRVWNADTGKCLKTLEGHTGWVNCISVLPDGRPVSGSDDGTIRIWDADTGKCLNVLEATEADVSEMNLSLAEFADDGVKKLLWCNRAKV